LYQRMYEQVKRLIPTDVFYLALYDELNGQWRYPYIVDRGNRQWDPTYIEQIEDENFRARVLQDKIPLLIPRSPQSREQEPPDSDLASLTTPYAASLLLAPILLPGKKLMGVLSVQSYTAHAYAQEHLHMLSTIASQASGAIQGAQQLHQARTFAEV